MTFRLLPRKADAADGKPRGADEATRTAIECIKQGTKRSVTDCFRSSGVAVKRLKLDKGYKKAYHSKE